MRENLELKTSGSGLSGNMRNSRFSVHQLIKVIDLDSQEEIGHVLDINNQGIGIFAKKDLTGLTINMIRLKMSLPDQPTQFIDLKVSLRWCKKQTKLDKYTAGFAIHAAVDKKSKMRIGKLIRNLSNPKDTYEENNIINYKHRFITAH